MRILIGIHVHAEPLRLEATLLSVRAHAPADATVVLLPDGPDGPTRAALAAAPFDHLRQLGTPHALGTAACWNRLVACSDAPVVMLLESGSLLAPGSVTRLMDALADARHGLAGPSTNSAWNEQAAFRGTRASSAAIQVTALQAAGRFGTSVRSLNPLHSLADFCFVVRRDVIESVGAADEAYGLGPCWEMDYSIRAARAGFLGVWVCGAYVHRMPFTARRRDEEARHFETSRQRYQDKFCGRRLRGESMPYEPHCKGEDCEHFAPRDLIRIHTPYAPPATANDVPTAAISTSSTTVSAVATRPLVSCIMPTRNRRAWIPQALSCFLRQEFEDAELVILDDGEDSVADCIPVHPRIRYFRVAGTRTIGAKRNEACRLARGELVAHWDDDDWHAPSRLRRQVQALQAAGADLCGTSTQYFYQPSTDRAWRYQFTGHPAVLVGLSLMYRRRVWERSPFPEIQVGEDVQFVRSARGRALDLADPALSVGSVHEQNTCPRPVDAIFWREHPAAEIHQLLAGDLAWYRQRWQPLVSCIMPTCDRRSFVPLSLRCFDAQDWAQRELIVVDDGNDPIDDLVAPHARARYIRLNRRTSIGAKRNIACAEARGELIAHWDDDDWYGPQRLSQQAAPIVQGQADLTGLQNRFMLRLPQGDFWATRSDVHRRMFVGDVHGGTLVFRRSLLREGISYPETNLAEDAALIKAAVQRGKRLLQLPNPGQFVYVRHGRNTWQFDVGTFIDPKGWTAVAAPALFSPEHVAQYRAVSGI